MPCSETTRNPNVSTLEVDAAVGRSAAGASFAASVGVAALVSIALVAGVTVFFNITKSQYQADTAEIQAWLDSAETAQRLAAVDAMQEKVNKVTSFRDGVQNAINLYEAHPVLDTQVVSDIRANYEGTSAEILSMNISNGFINVIASVDDNTEPAAIAAKFVEQDIFDNITYTGFNFAGDEAVDVYEFQLTAQMREIPEEETAEETAEEVE